MVAHAILSPYGLYLYLYMYGCGDGCGDPQSVLLWIATTTTTANVYGTGDPLSHIHLAKCNYRLHKGNKHNITLTETYPVLFSSAIVLVLCFVVFSEESMGFFCNGLFELSASSPT